MQTNSPTDDTFFARVILLLGHILNEPTSRERDLALFRMGMLCQSIAHENGIPAENMYLTALLLVDSEDKLGTNLLIDITREPIDSVMDECRAVLADVYEQAYGTAQFSDHLDLYQQFLDREGAAEA